MRTRKLGVKKGRLSFKSEGREIFRFVRDGGNLPVSLPIKGANLGAVLRRRIKLKQRGSLERDMPNQ